MVRIKVTPHQLHEYARQMRNASSDITGMMNRLEGAYNNLDLEVPSLDRLQLDYSLVTGKAGVVASQLLDMSAYLERKARDFEKADQESASGLPGTPPIQGNLPPATPNQQPWPFGPWPRISLPSPADLERIALTGLAIRVLMFDEVKDRILGEIPTVGKGKDSLELLQSGHYQDQLTADRDAYLRARQEHGPNSPEAAAAYAKYLDGYSHTPILGPFFKAVVKIDRIWGIQRGGQELPPMSQQEMERELLDDLRKGKLNPLSIPE